MFCKQLLYFTSKNHHHGISRHIHNARAIFSSATLQASLSHCPRLATWQITWISSQMWPAVDYHISTWIKHQMWPTVMVGKKGAKTCQGTTWISHQMWWAVMETNMQKHVRYHLNQTSNAASSNGDTHAKTCQGHHLPAHGNANILFKQTCPHMPVPPDSKGFANKHASATRPTWTKPVRPHLLHHLTVDQTRPEQ